MADYIYPTSGKPKEVHFDVTGKRPVEEEVQKLLEVVFPKKPLSESEKHSAIKSFFKMLGIGILCFIFGLLIVLMITSSAAGAGIVRLMGYTLLLGSIVCVIVAFVSLINTLFSSGRKEKVLDAFQWMWHISIFGNDDVMRWENQRFGSIQYAIDTLERTVPKKIDRDEVSGYITRMRDEIVSAMEKTSSVIRSQHHLSQGHPIISSKIEREVELFPNVYEINATIDYLDISDGTKDNKTQHYITACIKLHITQVFIKVDKYWYPYDIMPDFEERGAYKLKVQTEIEELIANNEQLSSPCKIQVYRDNSIATDKIKKWLFAFALNNGEKQQIDDGSTIEFSTSLKNNVLVGYGRANNGGLSQHPSIDSPFKFEAVEGGLVKLISKPEFYPAGEGKWKNNLNYDE